MKFARPAGGFKIILSVGAKALIDQQCEQSPEFARYWKDIVDRLSFVAHVEGVADNRFRKGCRLWASQEDEKRGLPRVKLVYCVLGDRVTILVASIN